MRKTINLSDFKESLSKRLRVLLPGAALSGPFRGGARHNLCVCYNTKYQLWVFSPPQWGHYFVFERGIPFTEDERGFLDRVLRGAYANLRFGSGSIDESMAKSIARTVSAFAAPDCPETALGVITNYESWREQLRGQSHATGIKITRKKSTQGNFFEIAEQDTVKHLGSSPDKLLIIDANGGILGLEKIPATRNNTGKQAVLSPHAHASLAQWANSRRKVAVRLTQDGTILLFSRGSLLFFKQDACWLALPHTLINAASCTQGVEGVVPETLMALYLTALDLAGEETCTHIALVLFSHGKKIATKLRKGGWPHSSGTAATDINILSALVNTRKFYEIPRATRGAICKMGGTLFLDGQGTILGIDPLGDRYLKEEEVNHASGGFFHGRGYMELLNDNCNCNLRLTIC